LGNSISAAQARHRVVFVQSLQCLGGRFDVPSDQLLIERLGDLVSQDSLAGARLALDQERAFERDCGVDGDLQILRRDISVGALETLHAGSVPYRNGEMT
jgi:hypothetical protein